MSNEVDDKEIEKFIEQSVKKDIDQSGSLDEKDIENKLGEMGFLWDRVQEKLGKDATCFSCKKEVDFSGGKINVAEASKVDKGVIAFVSLCEKCGETKEKTKMSEKVEEKQNE